MSLHLALAADAVFDVPLAGRQPGHAASRRPAGRRHGARLRPVRRQLCRRRLRGLGGWLWARARHAAWIRASGGTTLLLWVYCAGSRGGLPESSSQLVESPTGHRSDLTPLTGGWQDGPIGAQNLGWGQPTLQQGLQPSTPGSPPGNGARGGGGGRGRGRGTGKDAGKPPIRGGKGRGKVGEGCNWCSAVLYLPGCTGISRCTQPAPLSVSQPHGLLLMAPPCPCM